MSTFFQYALNAHIPVLGVTTDDIINARAVLQSIAGKPLREVPEGSKYLIDPKFLYVTDNVNLITTGLYTRLQETEPTTQAVVINPATKSPLVFEAGVLPTPPHLMKKYLAEFTPEDQIEAMMRSLSGMSLKSASEVVQITMARTHSATPFGVKQTRMMLHGSTPGLEHMDTDFPFYLPCGALGKWVEENRPYFLNENTPPALTPRGLILHGPPGVGKSLAASYVAQQWDVPLFRLDLAASLSKYIGESEKQIARILAQVDEQSPCVLLMDELEKLFGDDGENGTTQRILAQLLWWLQTHRSKVVTLMTTNNIDIIPPELYRPGRIDKAIKVPMLNLNQAKLFVGVVYKTVMGEQANPYRLNILREAIAAAGVLEMPHVMAETICHEVIKQKGWALAEEK